MALAKLVTAVNGAMGKKNPDIVLDTKKVVSFLPSGCFMFNVVSGGGFPRGRLTEVFGMEHSGKTALALSTHALNKRNKGVGIHIDAEFAFDSRHARLTYDLVQDDNFRVFQPLNAEECDNVLDLIIASGIKVDFISIDSVDALKPKAIVEGSLDKEARVGAQAKAVGKIVAKMRVYAMQTNTAILFLNQMRVNINTNQSEQNVGTGTGFNPMESHTIPGGYSLRFYASLRMKLEYGGRIEDEKGLDTVTGTEDKVRLGQKVKIINIKNKVAVPFLKGLANFEFPTNGQKGGWSTGLDLIDILKKRGMVEQRATKFIYKGYKTPEWTNIGSKRASESKFCKDSVAIADAEALVWKLIAEDLANEEEALTSIKANTPTPLLEPLTQEEIESIREADANAKQAVGSEESISMSSLTSSKEEAKPTTAPAKSNPFLQTPPEKEISL